MIVSLVVGLFSTSAFAVPQTISSLNKDDLVYLQRGFNGEQAVCIKEELRFAKSAEIEDRVMIDLDYESYVVFKFKDGTTRICDTDKSVEILDGQKLEIPYY